MAERLRLHPICRACAYDLSGFGAGQVSARCPECGAGFDPRRPWLIPAWPVRWRILARLVAPLGVALAIAVITKRAFVSGGLIADVVRLGLIVVAYMVAVAGAVVVVTGLTDRHLPMPRGMWIKGGLIVVSLAINLGGLFVFLVFW